jgi:RND family efflux transporter MFP subunit
MKRPGKKQIITAIIIVVVLLFGWEIVNRIQDKSESSRGSRDRDGLRTVPVEIAPIRIGSIELRRTFSGTLESPSKFIVAPKIGGRVKALRVDIGDTVKRNQVVAELDDEEYIQAVLLAKADLAVARANLVEAKSAYEIAERELKRIATLLEQGLASDSEYDSAKADHLAKQAKLAVSRAQVKKAEASLETARIRQGYTKVITGWTGGDDSRTVAERFVNEGNTVSANTPLLSIVELDPILGVFYITEKDYIFLETGQKAILTTDAYPEEKFKGVISRIAPVFRQETRQARVEITIENSGQMLKPGMFVRTTIVFDRVDKTTIVPEQALTKRENSDGVFVVNDDGKSVRWCEVKIGIREGDQVQVFCEGLSKGFVVTLGQQLIDDGSPILIPERTEGKRPVTDKEAGE